MIKFVICDDELFFRKRVCNVIDKMFMNNDIEYSVDEFGKYNKNFENIINTNMDAKIYILDIEIKDSISGIDIARNIRKNDWNSIIILVTSHSELGYEALKAQIMLLDFISKYDDCDKNLESVLRKAVKQVNIKKAISVRSNGITYKIFTKDILYVVKLPSERKCVIKTTYNDVTVNKNFNEIIEMLDDRFYLTHRSCIVNLDEIDYVDWNNSIINFKNGNKIDLIARDRKAGLQNYVNMV